MTDAPNRPPQLPWFNPGQGPLGVGSLADPPLSRQGPAEVDNQPDYATDPGFTRTTAAAANLALGASGPASDPPEQAASVLNHTADDAPAPDRVVETEQLAAPAVARDEARASDSDTATEPDQPPPAAQPPRSEHATFLAEQWTIDWRTVPPSTIRQLPAMHDYNLGLFKAATEDPMTYPHHARNEEIRFSEPRHIGFFFGEAREKHRIDTTLRLYDEGRRANREAYQRSPEEVAQAGSRMLTAVYELTANLRAVQATKAGFPRLEGLKPPQRMAVFQALDEINSRPKPPELPAYLRFCMPKFVWQGHQIPSDLAIPDEYGDTLQQNWSGYDYKESGYLAQPAELAAGQAPLHMALRAAQMAEDDGHADLGYGLKTAVVMEALRQEQGEARTEREELAYFHSVLPAAIVGTTVPAPKNAHFNYQGAIGEMMDQTWSRTEAELQQGEVGPGRQFLEQINELTYGQIAPYLARSILKYAERSAIDMAETLRGLRESQSPWATRLVDEVLALPNRPLMTGEEISDFAERLLPQTAPDAVQTEELAAAATAFGSSTDLYSFIAPLAATAPGAASTRSSLTVDIDPAAQEAQATIRYKANGSRYTLTLTADLAHGTVTTNSVDTEGLDAATTARYTHIIGRAIITEKARLDQAAEAQRPRIDIPRQPSVTSPEAAAPQPSVQPGRQGAKVKTRGVADPSYADADDMADDEQPQGRVKVASVESEAVAALLKGQGIKDIDPETVMQKIDELVRRANEGGRALGKPMTSATQRYEGTARINLRQVRWDVDGGRRKLRLYFRGESGGQLKLCGILQKKSSEQQWSYLRTLITRLAKEDKAERQQ